MSLAATSGSAIASRDDEALHPRGLLERVMESTGVGFAVLRGPECVLELVNPAYQALSPYREMLGRPFEAVWPEAAERLLPIFHRVMATGVPFEVVDMRIDIRRAQGGPFEEAYFSFACRLLPGGPGEVPALLAHVLDTTELVLARRQAEDRAEVRGTLLEAEHDAREQAERARDRFDMLARLAAEVNGGADLEEVVGTGLRLCTTFLGADDGVLRLIEEGGSTLHTFVEVRSSGRTGEALSLGGLPHSRAAAEAGRAIHLTVADAQGEEAGLLRRSGNASVLILPLTQERVCFGFMYVLWKAANDRLPEQDVAFAQAMADQCALAITRAWVLDSEKAARAAAEGLSRHQEMLTAILAHDLRSPIQAIAATSKALVQRRGLDERQLDGIGRIAATARHMERLVAELLDFARARQAGGIPVERVPADIERVCARAIRQQLDAHPGASVAFTAAGPRDGLWDPGRLEQAVSNLVENALERSPAGAAIQVRATGTREEQVLQVCNAGPVIPAPLLGTLFDPFQRGDRHGSVGLGLFIVSEVVHAHGGEIGVTSDPVDGTCFTVRLPRCGSGA